MAASGGFGGSAGGSTFNFHPSLTNDHPSILNSDSHHRPHSYRKVFTNGAAGYGSSQSDPSITGAAYNDDYAAGMPAVASSDGQLSSLQSSPTKTGAALPPANDAPGYGYWNAMDQASPDMQMWQGGVGSAQPAAQMPQVGVYPTTYGGMAAGGGAASAPQSPYSGYLEKQIKTYPIMIYTLNDCIPCQRAKHLLAVHYPDVRAHFLELSGNEPWQQQLQVDLQYLTGAITFPYIFVCGQYIGGQSDLFELHETGQLRRMVGQCLKPGAAAAAPAASPKTR
ncbi:Glutaredoxin [Aphelenchoides avenae]|nr:Glutaredoxin [Aphelenchus avenae]